ncbi:hypothetical protein F5882DRAFT_476620 [Hyaloscypha sp. PMI_1271]|nr:hypothetical protein F5882DRAFT_476620 [Hyaloscypha sp. PMI_1271]
MFLSKLVYSTPLIAALGEAIFIPTLPIISIPPIPIITPSRPIFSISLIPFPTPTPTPATPPAEPPSLATPLYVPTVGPAPKNSFTISHGLGGTTVPLTVTQTFESMDWSTLTISNLPPVAPPLTDRTETPTGETGTFTFQSVISGPATILQSGPALVQSNVNLDLNDHNSARNLYIVAVLASGKMQIFYHASSNNSSCHCPLNKT